MIVPPPYCKVSNASAGDDDTFIEKQGSLGKQIASVAAQFPSGRDHPVARDRCVVGLAHDVADGAMRAWTPSGSRDVAIGRNPAVRNASDHATNPRCEIGRTTCHVGQAWDSPSHCRTSGLGG